MDIFRRHLKAISIFMSTSLLFMSCSQYDDFYGNESVKSNTFAKRIKDYSGEDIFKGIFFAKGEVADLLTNINNSHSYYLINSLSQNESTLYDLEINSVIKEIKTKHSSYFYDFKSQIESGSHISITEIIDDGAKKIFEAYIDKHIKSSEKENLITALEKINIDDYIISETGEIDYDNLYEDISDNEEFQPYFVGTAFIGVVLVVAAYVLVVHAAAAMTYVYAAWVAQKYAAIDKAKTVTRSNSLTQKSVSSELLINEIAEKLLK